MNDKNNGKTIISECPSCGALFSPDSDRCIYCHRMIAQPAGKKNKKNAKSTEDDSNKRIRRLMDQNKELTNVVIRMSKTQEYDALMDQHKAAFTEQIRAIKALSRTAHDPAAKYAPIKPYTKTENFGGCLVKVIVFWFLVNVLAAIVFVTDLPASFAGMIVFLILILLILWTRDSKNKR